jgi:hypothetical protein
LIVMRTEDKIGSLRRWTWCPPWEAGTDSSGWSEGVKAVHSEAWADEPADLARHWLGETKDAPEELLSTAH